MSTSGTTSPPPSKRRPRATRSRRRASAPRRGRPSDELEALAVLSAVEASQPAISETKLRGLVDHYGFEPGTPGTRYFELHAERDVEHARGRGRGSPSAPARGRGPPRRRGGSRPSGELDLLDGVESASDG